MADNLDWLDELIANDKPAEKASGNLVEKAANKNIKIEHKAGTDEVTLPAVEVTASKDDDDSQLGWLDELIANDTKVQQTKDIAKPAEVNLNGETEAPPPPGGYVDSSGKANPETWDAYYARKKNSEPESKEEEGALNFIAKHSKKVLKAAEEAVKDVVSGNALAQQAQTALDLFNAKVGYPLATIFENFANSVGLTDSDFYKKDLENVMKRLDKVDKSLGVVGNNKYFEVNTKTAMNAIDLLIPVMKSKAAAAAVEGFSNILRGITDRAGENAKQTDETKKKDILTTGDVAKDAAIGAVIGVAASKIGDWLGAHGNPDIDPKVLQFFIRKGYTEQQARSAMASIPYEQQAYRAAMMTEEAGQGVLGRAMRQSDDMANTGLLKAKHRAQDVYKVADTENVEAIEQVAKDNFSRMKETIKDKNIQVDTADIFKGVDIQTTDVQLLSNVEKQLLGFKKRLADENYRNLDEVLTFRETLNKLSDTATPYEKKLIHQIKSNLDDVVDNLDDDVYGLVKQANSDYKVAMQNKELSQAVKSATNEHGVIDYKKLKETIQEAGLNTEQARATSELLENYAKKFGNDTMFVPQKGSENWRSIMGWLGFIASEAQRRVIRWGEFGNNVAMQDRIIKYLKSSDTPAVTSSKIVTDYKMPSQVLEEFNNTLEKAVVKLNDLDSGMVIRNTSEVNQLRGQLQVARNETPKLQRKLTQVENRLRGYENQLSNINSKINKFNTIENLTTEQKKTLKNLQRSKESIVAKVKDDRALRLETRNSLMENTRTIDILDDL